MAGARKMGSTSRNDMMAKAADERRKWEGQPLGLALERCLDEPTGPGPTIAGLAERLQAAHPLGDGVGTWKQKLYGVSRGRPLSDDLFETLVRRGGWAPDQVQRLFRADVRMQLRCRKRRLEWYPEGSLQPVALSVITACNIDQTIALPDYLRNDHSGRRTQVETFSSESETFDPTIDDFEKSARRLTQRYGSPFVFSVGGSGINAAVTMRRLSEPHQIAAVTVSGALPPMRGAERLAPGMSSLLSHVEMLDQEGVDTSLVVRSSTEAGRTASVVMPHGADVRRVMVTFPGANVEFADRIGERAWEVVDRLKASQGVHVTSLFDAYSPGLVADIVDYAKSVNRGLRVSFDPGDLWSRRDVSVDAESVRRLLALADVLFVNEQELDSLVDRYVVTTEGLTSGLVGTALRRPSSDEVGRAESALLEEPQKAKLVRDVLMSRGTSPGGTLVVVKHRGAATAYASDQETTDEIEPLTSAEIVDDTGAGDAFAAGFLDGWIRDMSLSSALRLGLIVARIKLRHTGPAPAAALAAARLAPRA